MSNKESLLIDIDGVMADTMEGIIDYMDLNHGCKLAHEDMKDYNFDTLPRGAILEAMHSDGFFSSLDVITGAVRAVNRLREEYNGNVYVCSSPMEGSKNSEIEKRDWLSEYFDDDFAKQAIITSDKASVAGKVIIEDNPYISGGMWLPVIFDQPYNRKVNFPRMYGWHDLDVVRDILYS